MTNHQKSPKSSKMMKTSQNQTNNHPKPFKKSQSFTCLYGQPHGFSAASKAAASFNGSCEADRVSMYYGA